MNRCSSLAASKQGKKWKDPECTFQPDLKKGIKHAKSVSSLSKNIGQSGKVKEGKKNQKVNKTVNHGNNKVLSEERSSKSRTSKSKKGVFQRLNQTQKINYDRLYEKRQQQLINDTTDPTTGRRYFSPKINDNQTYLKNRSKSHSKILKCLHQNYRFIESKKSLGQQMKDQQQTKWQ